MYLVPSPLQTKEREIKTSHTERYIPGRTDTIYVPQPVVAGVDNSILPVTYVAELDEIVIRAMPVYVDNTVEIDTPELTGVIRATAYPYIENDSLKIGLPIEWNIQPRPIESIARVDSFFVVDSVFVESDIPFIEQPAVVATGTSMAWLLVLIILL